MIYKKILDFMDWHKINFLQKYSENSLYKLTLEERYFLIDIVINRIAELFLIVNTRKELLFLLNQLNLFLNEHYIADTHISIKNPAVQKYFFTLFLLMVLLISLEFESESTDVQLFRKNLKIKYPIEFKNIKNMGINYL
jgi:hypothetical protein